MRGMPKTPTTTIVRALRKRLMAAGDTARASAQQAYMKSDMPYAGVLARLPHHSAHRTPTALPLYEEMIVTGAWWDFVTLKVLELLAR
jgi:hypothetical protein